MSYLWHVTLTTGHGSRAGRGDVSAAAIALCRGLIDSALSAGAPIALQPAALSHFQLEVSAAGAAMMATISGPAAPHVPGRPAGGTTMPLVTMGVAPNARVGPRLWSTLTDLAGDDAALPDRPQAPWLGVVVHAGAIAFPDALAWLADLERCLAWAWIEGAQ